MYLPVDQTHILYVPRQVCYSLGHSGTLIFEKLNKDETVGLIKTRL